MTKQTLHTPGPKQITHTKTPWEVEKGLWANEGQIFIEGEGEPGNTHKQHVAKMGYSYDKQGEDQREANAQFIVKACNAHQGLVNALGRLLVGITNQSTVDCEWYEGILDDAIEEAQTALRNTKEGV